MKSNQIFCNANYSLNTFTNYLKTKIEKKTTQKNV